MNRRGFLTALLGASAAAVAAEFGAPEYMGEEIKRELSRDLDRTVVGFSDVTPFEPRPIWQSVSGTAKVWEDHLIDALSYWRTSVTEGMAKQLDRDIHRAVFEMVSEMDHRLQQAKVSSDENIIVDTPQLQNVTKSRSGQVMFEIASGVEQTKDMFGETRVRVGYLNEHKPIVDMYGRDMV